MMDDLSIPAQVVYAFCIAVCVSLVLFFVTGV